MTSKLLTRDRIKVVPNVHPPTIAQLELYEIATITSWNSDRLNRTTHKIVVSKIDSNRQIKGRFAQEYPNRLIGEIVRDSTTIAHLEADLRYADN